MSDDARKRMTSVIPSLHKEGNPFLFNIRPTRAVFSVVRIGAGD